MRILVIEDDQKIGMLIKCMLESYQYVVDVIPSGRTGMRKAIMIPYDGIVVDLYLPDVMGDVVVRSIRTHKKHIPILMLTAESHMDRKVEALESCDDYLTKPFHMEELLARLRAITRRGHIQYDEVLECADLTMNTKTCTVKRSGKTILLRNKEYMLLEYLLRNRDELVSRHDILDGVWDLSVERNTNTVDVHIRMLRKKIDHQFRPTLIHTIPGRGYKLGTL